MSENTDRLDKIEELLAKKKRGGNQLCWLKYNPKNSYKYDIIDAEEDIAWMIYEIKRLREENGKYREFIDTLRQQMARELGLHPQE
jgi:hypothetical protein